MRSLLRTSVAFGVLLSGMAGFLLSSPAWAASSTVEITDVNNAVNPADEWFQLYNQTKSPVTLTGWSVCNSTTCIALPTTTIESFSVAKFKASSLAGWPAAGLDGTNDMLAIKDNTGAAVDALNWGTPNTSWKNYDAFKDMLWSPGIPIRDANANQGFFRAALGRDTDAAGDWLTTATPAFPSIKPNSVPSPTTAAVTGSTSPAKITPATVPATNPKTGAEFPLLLALGLVGALLAVRYFRRGLSPQKNR